MIRARRAPFLWLSLVLTVAASAAEPIAQDRLDATEISALFDRAILDEGSIDKAIERFTTTAEDASGSVRQRATAWLTIAHLRWRYGQRGEAVVATDKALALRESTDGTLLKARLLDATGNADEAAMWYGKAAEATNVSAENEFIGLRLTMAKASNRNIGALVDLANQRDQAFRNRAAIVLALLGHPAEAIALYRASVEFGNPFRQHARLAHWAIESDDFGLAQAEAWHAYRTAGTRANKLYALALLVESYRKDDALGNLIDDLELATSGGEGDVDLLDTRVDVLIETENYDDAIEFYEATDVQTVDPAARRRLINLYDAAGRADDMVAEYQKLMATEPHVVHWFAGLASHYLNLAQPDDALAVWETLAAANHGRVEVLVEAAPAMVQMGFVTEAVAMVENHMEGRGDSLPALLFLFELRLARGQEDMALATLQRMEAGLEGTTGIRDLADAYERLNRPEEAIRILERLRDGRDELGYDERMRLAWLYNVAGRKEDALDAWRELWVSVDSAARRSLAESQFLLLATELNTLGDLVVHLEEKLFLKQADRNEIGLLVRIYTEVGDNLSATEVIEEFARYSDSGKVDRLRRLGKVHMMLADYSAYDNVLRQLAQADPENEVEHIQNIVLNMLAFDLAEESQGRFGEIQRWLDRLRELDPEGVSGEFEAGIYSMGGFNDEAIESYRRALVVHPENSDNLLLMADLMNNAGRRDEAVAILQYAAEHAEDDNAFVVAIDGIINMIGARSFGVDLTPQMRRIFRWTQRIILERIAGHNDKFYLYQLLADIAQEVSDTEAEFRAIENSLSEAGVRRPAALRELVTLATANTGFAGFTTGAGDPERQLTHGRRLIGLKQELPPEVYIELGKALLEKGAVQGAVHAFDLINDITGLINVDKTKADLFLEAGHPDEALTWYTRALNVNKDDLALLTRTAMLREANAQDGVANDLYFRAVANVLRALPATRRQERPGANQSPQALFGLAGTDTSVTRDYRTYFEALAQGFLITWPQDRKTADARLAATRAMFDGEFNAVAGKPPEASEAASTQTSDGNTTILDLSEFTRLERTTWLARRVAERAGARSLAEHLESRIRGRFETKQTRSDTVDTDGSLLDRQLRLAKSGDDFEAMVRLARLAGDEDVAELFLRRIAEGKYREGLAYARALLDAGAFRRMVSAIAPNLKDNGRAIVELIESDPDLALEIEADLGRDLISNVELQDLLADPQIQASRDNNPFSIGGGIWKYLQAKTDVDNRIRYFASNVARQKRGQPFRPHTMLHDLLASQLSASQQEDVLAAATEFLAKRDLASEFERNDAIGMLLASRIIAVNYPIVFELSALIQRRAQLAFDFESMMKDILQGSEDQAFAALLALRRTGFQSFRGGISAASDQYAAHRAQILEAVADGDQIDAETVRIVYEFEFPRYFGILNRDKASRQAEMLPTLIARYPNDERYRRELVAAHWDLGNRAKAEAALSECYRGNPEDEFIRAALYFLFLYEGKFAQALQITTDGGPDLRDQVALDALLRKVQSVRGFDAAAGNQLFRKIYQGAIEPSFSRWSPEVDRGIKALRDAAEAGSDEAGRRALRTVWRGAQAPSEEQRYSPRGLSTNLLLYVPLNPDSSDDSLGLDPYGVPPHRLGDLLAGKAGAQPLTLFDAIAREPYGAAEFDLYLRSLPAEQRRDAHGLYELLADAVVAAGGLDRESRELARRLGDLDDHDFTVWMLLRHRQDSPLGAARLAAFASRAAATEDPSVLQILCMARIYAKAGAHKEAAQHYRLLAARLVKHNEFADRRAVFTTDAGDALVNLSELIREFAEALPPAVARDTAASIIASARRADRHDAYTAYFDAFVLGTMSVLYDPKEAIAHAARISSTAAEVPRHLPEWHTARIVELARLHAMSGDIEQAVELLRTFITRAGDESDRTPEPLDQARYEVANPLGRLARLYGLAHLDRFDQSVVPFHDLIARHDRLFPAAGDNRWSGDTDWMARAADALVSWLDDPDIDRAAVLEVAFVVAWQLHNAGDTVDAKAVVSRLATRITADPGRLGLQHLAVMALRLGNVLPVDLAAEVLAQGTLAVDQEVEVLQGLQRDHDAATVLDVGRHAPGAGQKLPLTRLLRSFADAAGDTAYAADLAGRIDAAEEAKQNLRITPPG